jgi:hypothetical protein
MVDSGKTSVAQTAKDERSAIFEVRVKRGAELKEEGNTKFLAGEHKAALALYRRALYQLNFGELAFNFELMDQHREQVTAVQLPLYLNAAACTLHLEKNEPNETPTKEEEGGDARSSSEGSLETPKSENNDEAIESKGEAQTLSVDAADPNIIHDDEDDEDKPCDDLLDETLRLCGLALKIEPKSAKVSRLGGYSSKAVRVRIL